VTDCGARGEGREGNAGGAGEKTLLANQCWTEQGTSDQASLTKRIKWESRARATGCAAVGAAVVCRATQSDKMGSGDLPGETRSAQTGLLWTSPVRAGRAVSAMTRSPETVRLTLETTATKTPRTGAGRFDGRESAVQSRDPSNHNFAILESLRPAAHPARGERREKKASRLRNRIPCSLEKVRDIVGLYHWRRSEQRWSCASTRKEHIQRIDRSQARTVVCRLRRVR